MAPVPPLAGRAGWSLEYYLNMVRMPCDRAAAALAARSAAGQLRQYPLLYIVFSILFLAITLFIVTQVTQIPASAPGPIWLATLVFLLLALLFLAPAVSTGVRNLRAARDLEGLARAIESGLLDKRSYCDKTLYQALTVYKARRSTL